MISFRRRVGATVLARCDYCGTLVQAPRSRAGYVCDAGECQEQMNHEIALGL